MSILSQHLDDIETVTTIQVLKNDLKLACGSIHGDI